MSTLFIRHPARADGEGALAQFALVADGGNLVQQGEGALRSLGDLMASARRVVLVLAAPDVTLLHVKVPPLSAARLKTALPNLVEEQVLGDPADCVLVAAPVASADGMHTVAVTQKAFLEPLVKAVLGFGAHAVSAVPAQLCLPLQPGSVSAAISDGLITLRHAQYAGLGLALDAAPDVALHTVRALAGDSPLQLYVAPARVAEFQALASDGVTVEADGWAHWIAGSKTSTLDLVPGLGSAGTRARDWNKWRWPLRIAALAIIINIIGLNVEWLRLKREADALRQGMTQTFRAAYPKETVIQDPAAQMKRNIAAAKAAGGQVGPDDFLYLAAALGEATRTLAPAPVIAAIEFREHALTVKIKPDTLAPGMTDQVRSALAARQLVIDEPAAATWVVKQGGGRP